MSSRRAGSGQEEKDVGVFKWGVPVRIDTGQSERDMWLVKIPPSLAEGWGDVLDGKDGAGDRVLGNLVMQQVANPRPGQPTWEMSISAQMPEMPATIAGEVEGQEVGPQLPPQQQESAPDVGGQLGTRTEVFDVRYSRPPVVSVVLEERNTEICQVEGCGKPARARGANSDGVVPVLCGKHANPNASEEPIPEFTLAAAGAISRTCHAVPRRLDNASARARVLSGERKPKPKISVVDPRQVQRQRDILNHAGPAPKRDIIRRKAGKETAKRIPKEELEGELFRLFAESDGGRIHLNEAQASTNQPEQYLRDVLNGIANKNATGIYRGLWELKPQYRSSGR